MADLLRSARSDDEKRVFPVQLLQEDVHAELLPMLKRVQQQANVDVETALTFLLGCAIARSVDIVSVLGKSSTVANTFCLIVSKAAGNKSTAINFIKRTFDNNAKTHSYISQVSYAKMEDKVVFMDEANVTNSGVRDEIRSMTAGPSSEATTRKTAYREETNIKRTLIAAVHPNTYGSLKDEYGTSSRVITLFVTADMPSVHTVAGLNPNEVDVATELRDLFDTVSNVSQVKFGFNEKLLQYSPGGKLTVPIDADFKTIDDAAIVLLLNGIATCGIDDAMHERMMEKLPKLASALALLVFAVNSGRLLRGLSLNLPINNKEFLCVCQSQIILDW